VYELVLVLAEDNHYTNLTHNENHLNIAFVNEPDLVVRNRGNYSMGGKDKSHLQHSSDALYIPI